MKAVALTALLALGCAAGSARLNPDGSCEARGIALGRAEIAVYDPESSSVYSEDPNSETRTEQQIRCRVGGGSGSAAWWSAAGAVLGALIAALF